MDMNAFRNYLSNRANAQGEENKPTHNVFGKVLADLKQTNTQEAHYTSGKATGKGTTSVDLDPKKKEKKEEFSLTGRDILESFAIVDNFYTTVMESVGLNEESEDLDSLVEEVLQQIDLDEVYGTKLPSVSQGLSDEEKRKVQKGETSKMPKSGVQDKIPGEKQSSVDAVTAVLGSKKNTVSDSSY